MAQSPARLLPVPPALPTSCGIASHLTFSARFISTAGRGGSHTAAAQLKIISKDSWLNCEAQDFLPSEMHVPTPRDLGKPTPPAAGRCCTLTPGCPADSSNKNNSHPSRHKVLFSCLGQWLRLVSVMEISCFEQARAARKDQRHGGSEETH